MLERVNRHYLADEVALVQQLIPSARLDPAAARRVNDAATRLVAAVRADQANHSALDRFLREYGLDSAEGVVLMCLAEAFQRIPDTATADQLISDKLGTRDWASHLDTDDVLVHAATWGFMLGGHVLPAADIEPANLRERLLKLLARAGEPLVRAAVAHAMSIMSEQFVMGANIDQALKRAAQEARPWECFSYDILGEAALTSAQADSYLHAYEQAIDAVAADDRSNGAVSIKLSALHPRYEPSRSDRVIDELADRLGYLAACAATGGIQLTVDAEESARLTLSLAIFERALALRPRGEETLGLAVQAYQKRAPEVLSWLAGLAQETGHRIPVRLVKGAYWDSEIKHAQQSGLSDFPVYTRKCHTDVAYLACARQLLAATDTLRAQFATHNAHTVASVLELAPHNEFEFQRLHGMGDALYAALNTQREQPVRCRVYAPVGDHAALLPYLVRRLLENGANTSFVHRIADPDVPAADITADPVTLAEADDGPRRHPGITLPADLFLPSRQNSAGLNFADPALTDKLLEALRQALDEPAAAAPVIAGTTHAGPGREVRDPANHARVVGTVRDADTNEARAALAAAADGAHPWAQTPATDRAAVLDATATLIEANAAGFMALIVRETGKTVLDAHGECREAVDLLRFYAAECRRHFAVPAALPAASGETNHVVWRARGIVCCISPWNFPLAIFCGQVAAALAAGNSVIAKPAEQACLTAARAAATFYAAGVPDGALQFLPGDGPLLGRALLSDERIAAVAFTGSENAARDIAQTLADRRGPPAALIAETGGINALIADSTALAEQLVEDVVVSAFNSAGQRCSALRVVCLQREIATPCLALLTQRLAELNVGDPLDLATDIGPLIDHDAWQRVTRYIADARNDGRLLAAAAVPGQAAPHWFVAPAVVRIDAIADLREEVFGPVLHVYEFEAAALTRTVDEINALGFGLTFGIHTRITGRARELADRSQAGNVYVNRNMIGAVVESQPFGGRGRSGTGPKAGGYEYVRRFATEQTVTINTAAAGGNPGLLGLDG